MRNLEREIGRVARKVATRIAEGQKEPLHVRRYDVAALLGKPRYFRETALRTKVPGVATGLSVTSAGGDLLLV